jgi:transcriptional regulator with XRE-family HTH domain
MPAFGDAAQRERLGRALHRLRASAGLSQPQLAAKLGWSQAKVSRAEGGKQRIKVPEVDMWCRATDASDQRRQELLKLAEEALLGPASWDEARGDVVLQRTTAEMEVKAGLLSVYQPAIIPGLLQTATYARRVFSAGPAGELPDVAERVIGRLERQRILYDESKELRFVVPETVLRWPFGPPAEQVEQMERLGEVMRRPNVDVRILPMARTSVWRTSGFVIFDRLGDQDPFVHLELLTRPINIDEPDQVATFERVFANLREASVAGEDARTLLGHVIDDMRRR